MAVCAPGAGGELTMVSTVGLRAAVRSRLQRFHVSAFHLGHDHSDRVRVLRTLPFGAAGDAPGANLPAGGAGGAGGPPW